MLLGCFSTQNQGSSWAARRAPQERGRKSCAETRHKSSHFPVKAPSPCTRRAAGTVETPGSTRTRLPLLLTPCHQQLPADQLPGAAPSRWEPGSQLDPRPPEPSPARCPPQLPAAPGHRAPQGIPGPAGHCSPAERSSPAAQGGVREKVSACLSRLQPCSGAHSSVAALPVPPSAG